MILKTTLFLLLLLGMNNCSYFRVTGMMCDNINTQAGDIPQECRDYKEEEAAKAFNKVEDDKKVSGKDLEFDKEKEE